MASHSLGLSLHEAARQKGVPFILENAPTDQSVRVNGMNFHYLEWGQPGRPGDSDAARRRSASP